VERPHHLVILMFDDVAVPDVVAGQIKLHLDPSYFARIGDDRIFETGFPRFWLLHAIGPTSKHLKFHQVNMNGVSILGEIMDRPLLSRA